MYGFFVTKKYRERHEIIQQMHINLEIVINYLSSFVLGSERALTFKGRPCLIAQKNIKQVDSLSCP